jgi:hypothetical protein
VDQSTGRAVEEAIDFVRHLIRGIEDGKIAMIAHPPAYHTHTPTTAPRHPRQHPCISATFRHPRLSGPYAFRRLHCLAVALFGSCVVWQSLSGSAAIDFWSYYGMISV